MAKRYTQVAATPGTGGSSPIGGTTAARPVTPAQYTVYWDTTLGIPVWYVGVLWYNAAGVQQ